MNKLFQHIYQYLPYKLKEVAAGIYARNLQSFRKDKSSEIRVENAAKRENWSRQEWEHYQQEELDKVLYRAAYQVPYYKSYWQKRGYENNAWKILNNWPILTKQELRENNHLFLAEDCDPKNMYTEYTSGTSGTPLTVYWSKETTLEYYAIFERRIKNWHGVNWNDPYIMLGGRLIIPAKNNTPPFWIKNKWMNQLYLSSYHLSPQNIADYVKAINNFKPKYMFGYASSMYSLAKLIDEANLKVQNLFCAISNAEPLLEHQIETIKKVFKCELVNTYGMSELVAGACSFQKTEEMVIWPEVGFIEVLDYEKDISLGKGKEGRLICTSLLNKDMPLIRYEVGDSGIIEDVENGIQFQKITNLLGRIDDLVITEDGRRIGRLDPVFKNNFNIKEAQIVQKEFNDFVIKIVPDKNYNSTNSLAMVTSLKERVGDVNVTIEICDNIDRTNTGKFKAVISHIKRTT